MNNRVEIRIAIVGTPESGKETFSNMLFLENHSKIKVDPLSKISEMVMEIDTLNFQKTSKKIADACIKQNNIILQQNQISDTDSLRNNNINPLFYRCVRKIKDLVDQSSGKIPSLNKNILLTFYIIGNNYCEFVNEIKKCNIIIYLTDYTDNFDEETELLKRIVKIIEKSSDKKYLLTIINKCDNLNPNGELDVTVPLNYQRLINLDRLIREHANNANIHQNLLPPIVLSSKYSLIFRQIIYSGLRDIADADKIFISSMFNSKNIIKDIQKNPVKYLKRSGYINFRDILSDIINTNYRSMVDVNFDSEIGLLKDFLGKSNQFIDELNIVHNRANRLGRIFKKDYMNKVNDLVEKFLNETLASDKPDLSVLEQLQEKYTDDPEIKNKIISTRNQANAKTIASITDKLYKTTISKKTYLPSKVHILMDKLLSTNLPKIELNQLVMHICELYGCKTITFLGDDTLESGSLDLEIIYQTFFSPDEIIKITSMLNEIMPVLHFDIYQTYLIQIMLAKLILVEKCIGTKSFLDQSKKEEIVKYCISLKHHLSNNYCKKYNHIFNIICDTCTNNIWKLRKISPLTYISQNLDKFINFKPDNIIVLEKFITKIIKKNNYRSIIAADEEDSNEDSDVDIYGEEYKYIDFDFTKDDLDDTGNMDESDNSDNSNSESNEHDNQYKKQKQKREIVDV